MFDSSSYFLNPVVLSLNFAKVAPPLIVALRFEGANVLPLSGYLFLG